jgi:hypothetical protein
MTYDNDLKDLGEPAPSLPAEMELFMHLIGLVRELSIENGKLQVQIQALQTQAYAANMGAKLDAEVE